MANQVEHSPGGERDATQRPASDGEDWRVVEDRNQAVLRAGLAAISLVANPNTTKSQDPALEPSIQNMKRALSAETQTSSGFEKAINREIISLRNLAPRRADWSVCKVVELWIECGKLIREAHKAIDDEGKKETAIATRLKTAASGLWNLASRDTHHSNARNMPRSERFEKLLSRLKKELTDLHPAFWCAAQKESLRVDSEWFCKFIQGAAAQRLTLASPAQDKRTSLEFLVAVTAEYRLVPAERGKSLPWPPAVFEEGRKRLVAEAGKLLGAECEAGSPTRPTSSTVQHWQPIEAPGNDGRDTIIAPPLFVKDPNAPEGRRLLARGVIALPDTAKLLDAMQAWRKAASPGDERPMPGPIARALERSGVGLGAWKSLIAPTTSKKPHEAGPVIEALLTYARLFVAVKWCGASAQDLLTPLEQLCLAVMLRGVRVRSAGESAFASSVPWRRNIPWLNEDGTGEYAAPASLDLCIADFKHPIGTRSELATCSAEIFAAVEDRDWRLWAILAVSTRHEEFGIPKEERQALDSLLSKCRQKKKDDEESWKDYEDRKNKMLSGDATAEVIANAAQCLVIDVLRLQQPSTKSAPEAIQKLISSVVQDTERCIGLLLERLHAIDSTELGGLEPPRLMNGEIDVFRWVSKRRPSDRAGLHWEANWRRSEKPFGTQLRETIEDLTTRTIAVTFSASNLAGPGDIDLLALAFRVVREKAADAAYFSPLVCFGASIVQRPADGAAMPDITAGLARLRDKLAGPDHGAFDGLIQAATAAEADPTAVHWVRLLCDDSRFRFECHPPIEWTDDGKVCRVKPFASDEMLEWQDSTIHDEGREIRRCFAIDKANSIRVLSRGQPAVGSPANLAGELEAVCSHDLPALKEAAESVRRGIDMWRAFPAERQRWLGELIAAITRVLEGVVKLTAVRAAAGADAAWVEEAPLLKVLEIVSRIAKSFGHRVTPAVSSLLAGATADAVPDSDRLVIAFHPTVPPGALIVDRFGIEGESGHERMCRRSAGPAPDGFDRLRALVDGLPGDALRVDELRQGIANLPRHVLGEKARIAIPSLYASVWRVLVEHASLAGEPTPWKEAIATLIRKPYDMVMFEPSKLGDYPADWIVGPDGKPPRGRRIAKVVRPGVQTLEKKLVWPAIVDTE